MKEEIAEIVAKKKRDGSRDTRERRERSRESRDSRDSRRESRESKDLKGKVKSNSRSRDSSTGSINERVKKAVIELYGMPFQNQPT